VRFDVNVLETLGALLLVKGGMAERAAATVASHVMGNALRGVDSHGVVRFAQYREQIVEGIFDPAGEATVTSSDDSLIRVDGGGGHGVPAMQIAAETVLERAREHGMATATVINCGHTGRIGAFAETIARGNCLAVITGGGSHARGKPKVAPYGGREGVMSTNPYAFALPGGPTGAVVVDFATSVVAQGKLLAASKTNEPLVPGLILDQSGRPSTDVRDYYGGGVLLPAAGPKGYGLGLIAELLTHGVLGDPRALNWIMIAIDLDRLGAGQPYQARMDAYLDWVKLSAPAEGFDEVLIPGEPEQHCLAERERNGVPVADEVWQEMVVWANRGGIDLSLYPPRLP
jgi:LDH2 family malate/lactate/ureidoglycolate dehydrogenase